MLRFPAINPINISTRLSNFSYTAKLMEEVVHIPELESEELSGEAELVFSVDTSAELSLVAENTVLSVVVQDYNPENLTGELPNQPVATSTEQQNTVFSRGIITRELIEEAELVLVDTIGFSGIPENIVVV